MTDTNRNQKIRVPVFKSIEEEAVFWDTHSVLDYLDEFEPPQFVSKKKQSQGITVRFEPETLAELRAYAQEKGIGPTTLMRIWVLEHLKQAKKHASSK
ncbi:MAG: CopG family antitoxin [Kouleothrix sp.]